jgi:predicted transposase/invertase (TIGR01784 family)
MDVGRPTFVTNPHDALFRFTFGQVEHALGLLRLLVPRQLAAAIDWRALQAHPTTTADQGLRLHHADLLFQAELLGAGREPLFFLLEHKSAPDEALPRQLLRYVMHIVTGWQRAQPTVPHVVPVVEGKAEGRAEVLLRQLTARFGPLPADLTARVRSASSDALDHWALRILDARSLAEVFVDR